MNKKYTIYILIVLIITAGVYYFYSGSQYGPMKASFTEPTTVPATNIPSQSVPGTVSVATHNVSIANFSFEPKSLNIRKGDTVVWTNKDSAPHQIAGTGFSGSVINNGESYTFVFNDAGTFDYHCAIHPSMTGKVIVN